MTDAQQNGAVDLFGLIADMEDQLNAARDYAFLLNDRLNRAEGAEREEMAALGRVAGDLNACLQDTAAKWEELFNVTKPGAEAA